MAYNEQLADRMSAYFEQRSINTIEKKMMGGLCFMVEDKMCVGVVKDDLMARIGPIVYEKALEKPGCRPMDFTGRPMKGYVFVSGETLDHDATLEEWIDLAMKFNPEAKSSKKKRRS